MECFSMVRSRALLGLQALSVTVEVHLTNGLPSFTLVGLADTEVKEARERVRSAIQNSGLRWPHSQRITVNLAPADLPKDSGRFDLPIALGILAASGQVDGAALADWEFAGELSLGGELRAVRGALAMSLALSIGDSQGRLVLPVDSASEAALVPDAEVYGARHLLDVVGRFAPPGATPADAPLAPRRRLVTGGGQPVDRPGGLPGPGRRERPGLCQARAGNRRCRGPQPADGRSPRFGQVDVGAAFCRPAAANDAGGSPGERGHCQPRRPLHAGTLGRAPSRFAAPHGQRGGARGGRL